MASEETSQTQYTGTDQADHVVGTDQNDAFITGKGDDTIIGGGGDDYALGGKGEDELVGDTQDTVALDPTALTMVEDYTVTMTFDFEGAGYKNTLGMYKVDPDTGAISGVDIAWENASLAGSGGDLVGGQSSVTYDVAAGEQLGFFIIGNGYNQNDFNALGEGTFEFVNADGSPASVDSTAPSLRHVAVDGTITLLNGNIFHSTSSQPDHGLNIDGIDHTVAGADNTPTSFQIGFEDLLNGGDRDFDDVVFTVEVGAVNGAAIIGQIDAGTGGGHDRLEGREGDDNIHGNSGNDLLVGGGASTEWQLVDGKWVYDSAAVNSEGTYVAPDDNDVVVGGSGEDVLLGNGGNDMLYGGGGFDRINAGRGDDSAYGGSGDDLINLEEGNDYAEGGVGGDTINAGDGDDVVYGDVNATNMLRTTDGTTFDDLAALDAWEKIVDEETGMATVVQEIETVAGEPYQLTFEVAANLAAGATSGTIEVLYNGEVIDTIDATSGVFQSHTVEIVGTGGPGSISFRNVETSQDAEDNAPDYDTSGPIVTYESTLTVGGAEVEVSAFAPGQSTLYQVINDQFKVFDVETSEYKDVGEPFGFKMNAIGFNVENDMVYGIAKGNGADSLGNPVNVRDLVAIDAEGNTFRIGDTPVADFVGDFDDEGNLWTFQSSVNRITKIDVDNLDANGDPVVVNYYLPGNLFAGNTYDVAYNAAEDAFYAVKAPGKQGGDGEIVKIDVSNFDGTNEPVISKAAISGTLVDGAMQAGMAKGAYGAVFMDADGNVYAGLNRGDHDMDGSTGSSGGIYKFEVDFETGQGYAELLSDSQSTGSNDGASDPRAVDPFAPKDTTSTILLKSPELVSGAGGNDDLRGGDGTDNIFAGAGDDIAHGGDGNDFVAGDSGNDNIFGNDGEDVLEGGTGNDTLDGGDGDDVMRGGDGNDLFVDKSGDNVIEAGAGADKVFAGDGNDAIDGGAGADKLYGAGGDDTVSGGSGADTINAGTGDDVIDGGAGKDFLLGGEGGDRISGGADGDKIVGGAGADTIEGGAGTDNLWGGNWWKDGANDTFVYSHGGGKDIVHDFEVGHDQIDLSAYGLTYEDIQDRLIDRGWAVEINLEGIDKSGAGDKILLKSVKAEDLDADNFII